jgi:hypothetical protein
MSKRGLPAYLFRTHGTIPLPIKPRPEYSFEEFRSQRLKTDLDDGRQNLVPITTASALRYSGVDKASRISGPSGRMLPQPMDWG